MHNNAFHGWLVLDSLLITNMLTGITKENFKLKYMIDYINQLLIQMNGQTMHCYREANQVADVLAKQASTNNESTLLFQHQDLPRMAKGPNHLPRIRLRYDKAKLLCMLIL